LDYYQNVSKAHYWRKLDLGAAAQDVGLARKVDPTCYFVSGSVAAALRACVTLRSGLFRRAFTA
jgi:hypothetical protein